MKDDHSQLFTELYDEHWKRIYDIGYRTLADKDCAEDIAQSTFEKFQEQEKEILAEGKNPVGWLYITARNLCKQANTRVDREKRGFDKLAAQTEFTYETDVGLMEILPKTFSEEDCDVMVMYYEKRYSIKEIADKYGWSSDACKARIYRLRKEIEKNL